ncbi:hypothetical protein GGD56_003625 [Rhizobium mongolense]|uniref:Uncharacterized protein n=1 Tax=Rhizobium mongolense TaxID=57676 RepID=A0ABR6IQF9_9HYPH|nr:hypothetical protein [Rhizobium mongolense]
MLNLQSSVILLVIKDDYALAGFGDGGNHHVESAS